MGKMRPREFKWYIYIFFFWVRGNIWWSQNWAPGILASRARTLANRRPYTNDSQTTSQREEGLRGCDLTQPVTSYTFIFSYLQWLNMWLRNMSVRYSWARKWKTYSHRGGNKSIPQMYLLPWNPSARGSPSPAAITGNTKGQLQSELLLAN